MPYLTNYWNIIWRDCIVPSFTGIYQAMDSIKIVSIVDGVKISLWDFSIAIIVMGAIINLFINFTTPTLPDRAIRSKRDKKE